MAINARISIDARSVEIGGLKRAENKAAYRPRMAISVAAAILESPIKREARRPWASLIVRNSQVRLIVVALTMRQMSRSCFACTIMKSSFVAVKMAL